MQALLRTVGSVFLPQYTQLDRPVVKHGSDSILRSDPMPSCLPPLVAPLCYKEISTLI
jgi:hypothetical protein